MNIVNFTVKVAQINLNPFEEFNRPFLVMTASCGVWHQVMTLLHIDFLGCLLFDGQIHVHNFM